MTASPEDQYQALTDSVGCIHLENWEVLELSGEDRKRFLQGFCTADINGLQTGQVVEAFVPDSKGKTLGYVHVADLPERLLLLGHPTQAARIAEHLDRYLIRDKVTIQNLSDSVRCHLLAGPKAQSTLQGWVNSGAVDAAMVLEENVYAIASEFAGLSVLLIEPVGNTALAEKIDSVCQCSEEVLHAFRLQQGTPWFGIEVNESNLPQEIDRDRKAICFTKGCYLGQETVARIDALGRVNKLLRFATTTDGKATPGDDVFAEPSAESSVAGKVLAFAPIPGTQHGIASLMLKRAFAKSEQTVFVDGAPFVVQSSEAGSGNSNES